jgi:hypothetical protein
MCTTPYPGFKIAIVALLALNFAVYALFDTWIKAVDALVWLALLILYEMEAHHLGNRHRRLLTNIRTVLVILVPLIFLGYLNGKEWLDVINSLLWFILIALLEWEMRKSDRVLQYAQAYWLATIAVFCGLSAMVLAWLWKKSWLDAYDAALWLVAFGTIETDILALLKKKTA